MLNNLLTVNKTETINGWELKKLMRGANIGQKEIQKKDIILCITLLCVYTLPLFPIEIGYYINQVPVKRIYAYHLRISDRESFPLAVNPDSFF